MCNASYPYYLRLHYNQSRVSKVKVKAEGKVKPNWIKEKVEVHGRAEKQSGVIAEYSSNNEFSLFDNKIALAVEGLHPFYEKMLRERISKENALVIAEYINSYILSQGYKLGTLRIFHR